MKKILTIILVLVCSFSFGQKALKENLTGKVHKIESFKIDTLGLDILVYKVKINVYNEGLSGSYFKVIDKRDYNYPNDVIDYLSKEIEYINFKIIEL